MSLIQLKKNIQSFYKNPYGSDTIDAYCDISEDSIVEIRLLDIGIIRIYDDGAYYLYEEESN